MHLFLRTPTACCPADLTTDAEGCHETGRGKQLTVSRNAGLALQTAEVAHAAIGSAGRATGISLAPP